MTNISKAKKVIPSFCVFFAILSLALYFINFGKNGFSRDAEDWAHFGAYIGGTLTPIFTFATVFFAILTLRQQQREIQANHIRTSIEKLDQQLGDLLEEVDINTTDVNSQRMSLGTLLSKSLIYQYEVSQIPHKNDFDNEDADELLPRSELRLIHNLSLVGRQLAILDKLLVEHTKQSDANGIEAAYREKYRFTALTLSAKGWYENDWTLSQPA